MTKVVIGTFEGLLIYLLVLFCVTAYDLFNKFLNKEDLEKMGPLLGLEKALAGVFKAVPALPESYKKWLVKNFAWLQVILAAGCALWAWRLWDWAHPDVAGYLGGYYEVFASYYDINWMGAGEWASFIVLLVCGVVALLSFAGVKALKKAGWSMAFLGYLVMLVFGVVVLFSHYGAGYFVIALVVAIAGWYMLYQVRDSYSGGKAAAPKVEAPKAE